MGRFKRERKRNVPPAGRRGPAAIFLTVERLRPVLWETFYGK
jgi:hypothetical protein